MELDRALELSVLSSWGDLVRSNEAGSIYVEYRNIENVPLDVIEVWMMKNRGYGVLICRYSADRPERLGSGVRDPALNFANSYESTTLADNLKFIMKNQEQFGRHPGGSVHGRVQIESPSASERKSAAAWSLGLHAGGK